MTGRRGIGSCSSLTCNRGLLYASSDESRGGGGVGGLADESRGGSLMRAGRGGLADQSRGVAR